MVQADCTRTTVRLLRTSLVVLALTGLCAPAGAASGDSNEHMVKLLERMGAKREVAQRSAQHVALGMPKFASDKTKQAYLLVRNGYVLSYSNKRNAMNWASWKLSAGDIGELPRNNDFRPDPTLPKDFAVVSDQDYWVPGYVRGHMVRSGDRSANKRENSKTYVFSNILPQAHNNNSGPWNQFENYYRDRVKNDGLEAYVIAGGVFGRKRVPDQGKVAVPTDTWKVVAFLKPGQTAADITADTRVVAVLMPNNNNDVKVEYPWHQYRVPVSTIEKKTGLKFFRNVKPTIAKALRDKVDTAEIGAMPKPEYEVHNWEARGPMRRGMTGTVKWIGQKNGYTFGFLRPDKAGDKDVFVPGKLLGEGPNQMKVGDRVTYNCYGTERGDKATKVSVGIDLTPPKAKVRAKGGVERKTPIIEKAVTQPTQPGRIATKLRPMANAGQ